MSISGIAAAPPPPPPPPVQKADAAQNAASAEAGKNSQASKAASDAYKSEDAAAVSLSPQLKEMVKANGEKETGAENVGEGPESMEGKAAAAPPGAQLSAAKAQAPQNPMVNAYQASLKNLAG